MNSIIQKNKSHCYLCGKNSNFEPLDEHHVYGGSNRKLSEKYGLKVYLHHSTCHIFGACSVHSNVEIDKALKADIQKKAMEHYGWTVAEFRGIFGKNYI